jgi:hypothetical protein
MRCEGSTVHSWQPPGEAVALLGSPALPRSTMRSRSKQRHQRAGREPPRMRGRECPERVPGRPL